MKTGILSPNEWHFVALQLSTEGYQLYQRHCQPDPKGNFGQSGVGGASKMTHSIPPKINWRDTALNMSYQLVIFVTALLIVLNYTP